VTLPNIECANCTLQIIQVMNDLQFHFQPYPADDIYYACIDLVLSNTAPDVTDTPVSNTGIDCKSGVGTGGAGSGSAGTSAGLAGDGAAGSPSAGIGGSSVGTTAGVGGSAGTGAVGGAGVGATGSGAGAVAAPGTGGTGTGDSGGGDSGCSVRNPGQHAGEPWAWLGGLALCALWRSRRPRAA
jgi:hypothetical protein